MFRNWMVSQVKYDQPYFMAYLIESFNRYANLNISDTLIFSKEIAARIKGMFDGVRTSDEMNAMFKTLHVGELFYDDFEKDSTNFKKDEKYTELRAAFTENSVPAWNLNSNVSLYYGKDDMSVPNEQSLKIYSEFRTKGATSKIRVDAMNGLGHNEATIPTLSSSVIWFRSF
jgi:hypothetical protein